jgi:uroporphyrinogen-III decarboxylase
VGTPWTLAAYAMEGKADRDCKATKTIMLHNPKLLHGFLAHLTDALITYVCYQIESGAQVVQLFDSWAHHLSPSQFQEFSLPYANRVTEAVRRRYPRVPIIFHANGGERRGLAPGAWGDGEAACGTRP